MRVFERYSPAPPFALVVSPHSNALMHASRIAAPCLATLNLLNPKTTVVEQSLVGDSVITAIASCGRLVAVGCQDGSVRCYNQDGIEGLI